MVLGIKERLLLPSIFPKQGKFEDLVVAEDVVSKLKITQEEVAEHEIKQDGEALNWKPDTAKDFEMTDLEIKLIEKLLKELSDNEKLPQELVPVYKQVIK